MIRCRVSILARFLHQFVRLWATWITAVPLDADPVALRKVTVILTVNARAGLTVYRLPARMYVVPILLATWITAAIVVLALSGKAIAIMTENVIAV